MKITIITLFPKMIEGFINESIIKKAQDKGVVEIEFINLRDFALDSYGTVDDRPYGGGAGMVLRAEPLTQAIGKAGKGRVVLTSAKGKAYTQKKAGAFAKLKHLIIIAGHYEGVDERAMSHIDEEVSMGDYILTGGEIPAAAIVDSIVRLLPGVLKKEEATQEESFFEVRVDDIIEACGEDECLGILKKKNVKTVQLLEYPHYTRPEKFGGKKVPTVLLSGNHEFIHKWRIKEAYKMTLKKRPDLIEI
jgi:tRNA (guanine37-N1)-methyltransferase